MKKIITGVLLCSMLLAACGKEEKENKPEDSITSKSWVTGTTPTIAAPAVETQKGTEPDAVTEKITEPPKKTVAVSFDFETCEDAPVLSGEARELDWSMLFEEDCIVIGAEKYPAYTRICDLSSNFKLGVVNIGADNPDNANMLNDYYTLYCLDKKVCGIIATRKASVEPENAYISAWTLGGFDEIPEEKLGLLGFSLAQSAEEVAKTYTPDETRGNTIKYYGVTEWNGERFSCSLSHDESFATMLTITPYDVNPSAYKYYADK